jgi:hypothetical protein
MDTRGGAGNSIFSRRLGDADGGTERYLNLENFTRLYFDYKWTDFNQITAGAGTTVRLIDNDADMLLKNLAVADNNWNSIDITSKVVGVGAGDWTSAVAGGGTFEWDKVYSIRFDTAYTGATDQRIDGLYIERAPMRSENTGNDSGYDATSAELYGTRQTSIKFPWLKDHASLNAVASNLLNYFKDPQYHATLTWDRFYNARLNDNIKFNYYDTIRTLPVHQITWNFAGDNATTNIVVGTDKRKDVNDVLKLYSSLVDNVGFDRGIDYYVY